MKNKLRDASPLKIMEKASRKNLGAGAMGVLIARAGVGKTACLINMALHELIENRKVVHVSLEEGPEKINAYYRILLNDLIEACNSAEDDDSRLLVEGNRVILAFVNRSFDLGRLRVQLNNLKEAAGFNPEVILVDGVDFVRAGRTFFEEFSFLAREFNVEVWLTALSHRHISEVNERGIPYPCHDLDDLFSVIIHLQPETAGLYLRLLKDHDNESVSDTRVRLTPTAFMDVAEGS